LSSTSKMSSGGIKDGVEAARRACCATEDTPLVSSNSTTASRISSRLAGLNKLARIPVFLPFRASFGLPLPESKMTGTLRQLSMRHKASAVSTPFMPGIKKSITAQSNLPIIRSQCASAAGPERRGTVLAPQSANIAESRSRLLSLSSTSRILRPESGASSTCWSCSC